MFSGLVGGDVFVILGAGVSYNWRNRVPAD